MKIKGKGMVKIYGFFGAGGGFSLDFVESS
jgi:hypothetical protein